MIYSVDNTLLPQIISAEKDYLIVYKPPRMHSSPQPSSGGDNILAWCAERHPEIMDLPGRRKGEGGLLHRLDFETQGLMLIARTLQGMEMLLTRQNAGCVSKEYSALTSNRTNEANGFLQGFPGFPSENFNDTPLRIESMFRPYGPGRKEVRPVLVNSIIKKERSSEVYVTEIVSVENLSNEYVSFVLRIAKGFRHQIRCHLAWLGKQILNDKLYGGETAGKGFLALRASSLSFRDLSGTERRYSLPPITLDEI